jgi:anhydro-N-acetylmuramic acid kinase
MLAVGLMSGTSCDGVDAALVGILPDGERYQVELLRLHSAPFERNLRAALLAALPPNAGSVADVARLHGALGRCYGSAARVVAAGERIGFVASHGQTIWHDGAAQTTLQLGDAFAIREAVDATVCYDFRSADCAAGGHGAPLVARVDALLLSSDEEARVALNIGGIANVTLLPAGHGPDDAVAFDTGPGNMLLDAHVRERTSGAEHFDRDGELAAAGTVDRARLEAMLSDDYFSLPNPKTTGRERFGAHFLQAHGLSALSSEDAAATLCELTVESIAREVERAGFGAAHVVVSGGGARNPHLMARLAARLGAARIEPSDAMGIPAEAKEAIAFAVLGYETLRGRAGNVPAATGAGHPAVLGAIAPCRLRELLAEIAAECVFAS